MKVTIHTSRFGQEYWLHLSDEPVARMMYRFAAETWERRASLGEPWESIGLFDVPPQVLARHADRVGAA